jgi:hypothetical protein
MSIFSKPDRPLPADTEARLVSTNFKVVGAE